MRPRRAVPSRRTPSARARGRVPDRKQRLPPRIPARRPRMPGRPARRRQPRPRPNQPAPGARPPARTKARRPPPHRAAGRCADAAFLPPGPTTRWRAHRSRARRRARRGSVRPHRGARRAPRAGGRTSASFTLSAVNFCVAQLVVRSVRAHGQARARSDDVLPRQCTHARVQRFRIARVHAAHHQHHARGQPRPQARAQRLRGAAEERDAPAREGARA